MASVEGESVKKDPDVNLVRKCYDVHRARKKAELAMLRLRITLVATMVLMALAFACPVFGWLGLLADRPMFEYMAGFLFSALAIDATYVFAEWRDNPKSKVSIKEAGEF